MSIYFPQVDEKISGKEFESLKYLKNLETFCWNLQKIELDNNSKDIFISSLGQVFKNYENLK